MFHWTLKTNSVVIEDIVAYIIMEMCRLIRNCRGQFIENLDSEIECWAAYVMRIQM